MCLPEGVELGEPGRPIQSTGSERELLVST